MEVAVAGGADQLHDVAAREDIDDSCLEAWSLSDVQTLSSDFELFWSDCRFCGCFFGGHRDALQLVELAMHEDDEVFTLWCLWRSDDIRDKVSAVDFVRWVRVPFVRDFEETRGSRFAGKRTAFAGTGADYVVRHDVWGGRKCFC